jgi:hypothetical protein
LKVEIKLQDIQNLAAWVWEDVLTRCSVMQMDASELEVLVLDKANVSLFGKTMTDPTIAAARGSQGCP